MDDSAPVSTVEYGGMTIASVGTSAEETKAFQEHVKADAAKAEKTEKAPSPKERASEAARELGKRGGKAAAEARERAKDAPPEKETTEPEKQAKPEASKAAEGEEEDEHLSDRARKRVEKATREAAEHRRTLEAERREREAERARYEARLAALETRGGRDERQPERQPERAQPQGKPRMEDFENYEEYLDARDSWNRDEWTRESGRRHAAEQEVATVKAHVDDFLKHVNTEFIDTLDQDMVQRLRPVHFMGEGEQLGSDNLLATEIMYLRREAKPVLQYLSDHPEAFDYFRGLFNPNDPRGSHMHIRVAVHRLAASLGSRSDATTGTPPEKGDRPSKVETSRAHPPVKPVTGAPHIAEGDSAPRPEDDFDSWYRRQPKKRA